MHIHPPRLLKYMSTKLLDTFADRYSLRVGDSRYQAALEELIHGGVDGTPQDHFARVSDDFWFWLNTEGCRRNQSLRQMLPAMPDEDIQLNFTGNSGDPVLREGFYAYRLFKEIYGQQVGELSQARSILDFGCGWGRIIRFFLKDVDPAHLWGCDPVQEMIDLCQLQNKWCQFVKINTKPPTPFPDNTFDFIYGYSVFSHLSEERHKSCLIELLRILKPGGLLVVTTRSRKFIKGCAKMRRRKDLNSIHSGPRSSASAFLETADFLSEYDAGRYCFHQLVQEGEWSYWGETAIPKAYVVQQWQKYFNFVDYIDDRSRSEQNVIVMRKPSVSKC